VLKPVHIKRYQLHVERGLSFEPPEVLFTLYIQRVTSFTYLLTYSFVIYSLYVLYILQNSGVTTYGSKGLKRPRILAKPSNQRCHSVFTAQTFSVKLSNLLMTHIESLVDCSRHCPPLEVAIENCKLFKSKIFNLTCLSAEEFIEVLPQCGRPRLH